MGLVMDTGSVKSQLADMNNNLEDMVTKAGNLWSRMNGFIDESGLNSDSYNNMKEYYASVHIPLLRGFISYAETLISSNERYSAQIDTYLSGVGYVDEDGLADELDNVKRLMAWMDELSEEVTVSWGAEQRLLMLKLDIERKLDLIADFRSAVSGIYADVNSLKGQMQSGIACMQGITYNAVSGKFDMSSADMGWSKELIDKINEKELFCKDGTLKDSMIEKFSNKSLEEMSSVELEQFAMIVERILSDSVTVGELTKVIDAYYGEPVLRERMRKDTAQELTAYIDCYLTAGGYMGLVTPGEMQKGMVIQAALSPSRVYETGKVSYHDGTYLYEYTEVTDRSYTGGSVTGVEKHVVEVGPAKFGADAWKKADREGDRLMGELIGFSMKDQVKGIVTDRVIDKVVVKVVEKSGEKGIEHAAVIGGILIDVIEDYSTAELGKEIAQIDDAGTVFLYLDLYYVSAIDGGIEGYQSKIYPSARTQNLIDGFNNYLDKEHQITYEEVMKNPHKVKNKLDTLKNIHVIYREIEKEI